MTVDREQTLRGEMIRVALRHLLAQDRFEANFVQDAERELDALLAELEQAEKDYDDATGELATELAEARAEANESIRTAWAEHSNVVARLAKVPALVETARQLLAEVDQGGEATDGTIALLEELVSEWERE